MKAYEAFQRALINTNRINRCFYINISGVFQVT